MIAERVTQHRSANEQLLYFTSSSLTWDDSHIVFISDRTGHPNLFVLDLASGFERQLTRNAEGFLKSYVYFDGTPYRGFGKASISLHAQSGTIYYIHGRDIRKVSPKGDEVTLSQYPDGQMTAFTHVSNDGRLLCVPTTDARALDGTRQLSGKPDYDIDKRVQGERLSSYLRVFDTETGREVVCERVDKSWITHVQFSPINNNLILYNHEWPSDCGIRRMWLFDGKKHIRLRTKDGGRSRKDWTCHEMWERDGTAIVYHGRYAKKRAYIGRVKPDGSDIREITLPSGFTRYGHFTVGAPNVLVSDGYYEEEGDKDTSQGNWISRVDVDWDNGKAAWSPLCRSGSSWTSQDEHPHPIFDQAMHYAYFTSDADGKRAVYRIGVKKSVEQGAQDDAVARTPWLTRWVFRKGRSR